MANVKYRLASTTPTIPVSTTAGSASLSNADIDGNFYSLNSKKLEIGTAIADYQSTSVTADATNKGATLYYDLNGNLQKLVKGTDGQVLKLASGLPVWGTDTDTVTTVNGSSGTITGIATTAGNLSQFAATTSIQLLGVISNATGTGSLVFATSPTLVTPILGTPQSGNLANCTFPTLNQNTTGNATSSDGVKVSVFVSGTAYIPLVGASGAGTAQTPNTYSTLTYTSSTNLIAANISGNAAGLSATLAQGSGGTGFSTYAAGDILYASAANTLSKLVKGADGQVLKLASGLPAWGTDSAAGATLSDDVSSNTTQYISMARATSGSWTSAYVASTLLTFNPSTGTLSSNIFTSLSDERQKSDIKVIENALDKTMSISGYTFLLNSNKDKRQTGVIAQEIQKVLPEVVTESDDENKTLTVAYGNIVGLLIEAIKELNGKVTDLQNQINNK